MATRYGPLIDHALADPKTELDTLRALREHAAAILAAQRNLKSALTKLDREVRRRESQVGEQRARAADQGERRLPRRLPTSADEAGRRPVHVVWELTLACNLKCAHCGSRAGKVRPAELTTEECFDVVDQLARLGTREITLIGGEAYLRRDWTDIIARITSHGILASMQTGGRALTEERVRAAKEAGLGTCGVSVDGLEELHDEIRGVKGSFRSAMQALELLRKYEIPSGCNTQIGSRTMPQLRGILHEIAKRGAKGWQIQLTVAMGNAVDNDHLLMQPYQLLELMPLLNELYDEARSLGVIM